MADQPAKKKDSVRDDIDLAILAGTTLLGAGLGGAFIRRSLRKKAFLRDYYTILGAQGGGNLVLGASAAGMKEADRRNKRRKK